MDYIPNMTVIGITPKALRLSFQASGWRAGIGILRIVFLLLALVTAAMACSQYIFGNEDGLLAGFAVITLTVATFIAFCHLSLRRVERRLLLEAVLISQKPSFCLSLEYLLQILLRDGAKEYLKIRDVDMDIERRKKRERADMKRVSRLMKGAA